MEKKRISFRTLHLIDTLIGTILTACLAIFATVWGYGTHTRFLLPVAFVLLTVLIARFFGTMAGVLGTIAAAVVFATYLFPPVPSIHVATQQARDSLNWLLLGGISLSFLFPKTVSERR
jgi:K+-sensing histidine kinase KdpD